MIVLLVSIIQYNNNDNVLVLILRLRLSHNSVTQESFSFQRTECHFCKELSESLFLLSFNTKYLFLNSYIYQDLKFNFHLNNLRIFFSNKTSSHVMSLLVQYKFYQNQMIIQTASMSSLVTSLFSISLVIRVRSFLNLQKCKGQITSLFTSRLIKSFIIEKF